MGSCSLMTASALRTFRFNASICRAVKAVDDLRE
jgi:hypothetical protein